MSLELSCSGVKTHIDKTFMWAEKVGLLFAKAHRFYCNRGFLLKDIVSVLATLSL